MSILPFLLIALPLGSAFVLPLLDLLSPRIRKLLMLGLLAAQGGLTAGLWLNWARLPLKYRLGGWPEGIGITLRVDQFGAIMITLVSLLAIASTIYSLNRIAHNQGKYYVLLALLTAGLNGAMATGDLFNFYVFTELVSIASYSLVAFERRVPALEAAFKYLLYGALAGVLFLLAVVLVYFTTGSLDMVVVAERLPDIPPRILATITGLFLVAFAVKMGLVPFHTWLSDAHAAAPSPVSALLSGVVIKLGAYGLIRIFFFIYGLELSKQLGVFEPLLVAGMLSVLIGHSMALVQKESKRLLAYSSIAQMGYIAMTIGTGEPWALGAVAVYIVAHAVTKAGLFLVVGSLTHEAGSRDIKFLQGAYHRWPLESVLFAVLALSILGVPPLVGFGGKWFITQNFVAFGGPVVLTVFVAGTAISAVYYLRFMLTVFGSAARLERLEPEFVAEGRLTLAARLPVFVLVFIALMAGIAPLAAKWDLPDISRLLGN